MRSQTLARRSTFSEKAEVDIAQVASASVVNANGVLNSGNDISMTIPNIRGLLPEDDREEQDLEEPEEEEDYEDPEDAGHRPTNKQKGEPKGDQDENKWWPREDVCLAKERELEKRVSDQRKEIFEASKKLLVLYEAMCLIDVDVKCIRDRVEHHVCCCVRGLF